MTDTYCLHLTSAALQDETSDWNFVFKKSLLKKSLRPDILPDLWKHNSLVSICLQNLCYAEAKLALHVTL